MSGYINDFGDLNRVIFRKEIMIKICKSIFITDFPRDQLNFIKITLSVYYTRVIFC